MRIFPMPGFVKLTAVAIGALFLSTACTRTEPAAGDSAISAPKALPAAPMITVSDTTGQEFSLAANVSAGKPSVVYFMASWCPICARNWEGPNQVVPKYQGTVDFIAISIDPTDTADVLQALAAQKNFRFRTSPGNPDAMMQFNVTEQTAKFAIDKDGNIIERHDGALTAEEWDAFFAQLVG